MGQAPYRLTAKAAPSRPRPRNGSRKPTLAAEPGGLSRTVAFTVGNARPVDSRTLFAMVDVEMRIAGVSFEILGVQARRSPCGTSIELPAVRDPGGSWRPAIRLPPELRAPLAEAVTAYLLETGLARPRFAGGS